MIIPLKALDFQARISETLVALKMTQTFINPTAKMVNEMAEHKNINMIQ